MVAYHWVKVLDSYDPNSQPPFETLKKAICSLCDAGSMSSRQYAIREAARYFNSGGHFLGEVNRRKDQVRILFWFYLVFLILDFNYFLTFFFNFLLVCLFSLIILL